MINKMIFRTAINIAKSPIQATLKDYTFFIGSCFADNISEKMQNSLLPTYSNPFGTAYNPQTIGIQLERIIDDEPCEIDELKQIGDIWYSMLAHSKISQKTQSELIQKLCNTTDLAHTKLKKSKILVITFGTAWVYKLISNQMIVANCHKLPSKEFERFKLNKDDIVENWITLINKIKIFNPNIKIIFTISPIRHLKETAHGNQLSKAELIIAIDEIIKHFNTQDIEYFPAYEIMLDELRDYRFYADDMIHPSSQAIDYIFEQFLSTFYTIETQNYVIESQKIAQAICHKQIGDSQEYKKFMNATLKKANILIDKYQIDIENNEAIKGIITTLKSTQNEEKETTRN